ncbi:outer membrane beta-barrel protein [Pedobacter jeongneungensis]
MRAFLLTLYLSINLLAGAVAQTKPDSVKLGRLNGRVMDSKRNFPLISATATIYNLKTNDIINYGLTNPYGYFSIGSIPVTDSLKLIISYIGYKDKMVRFKMGQSPVLDLKTVLVDPGAIELNEVTISSAPPVKIKGDTVEFNADAFKLKPNAVVEDLLRNLPGVIIWGDGKITVNGKNVSKILVDGKPFFGGNFKIATQNLPNQIIDKVQVTPDKPTDNNPIVSTVSVNLTLKEKNKKGLFGKASAGLGTGHKYDGNLSLNYFTPKMELTALGAGNNVNKVADNITTLLEDAVFKPSRSTEYLPDFNALGQNKFLSGGFNLSRSFSNKRKLNINFFRNNIDKIIEQNYIGISSLANERRIDSSITRKSGTDIGYRFLASYEQNRPNSNFGISAKISKDIGSLEERTKNIINDGSSQLSIVNNFKNNGFDTDENIALSINFDKSADYSKKQIKNRSYLFKYTLSYDKYHSSNERVSEYSGQLGNVNREYLTDHSKVNNGLEYRYRNIGRFIKLQGIQLDLINRFDLNKFSRDNRVSDVTGEGKISNRFLTNKDNYWMVDEKPSLLMKKKFSKLFESRYSKDLLISVDLQARFVNQKNTAMINTLNFNRSFSAFLPNVEAIYQYNNVGRFNRMLKAAYAPQMKVPSLEQLVALPDSSDLYNLRKGNIHLRPEYRHEFILSVIQSSYSKKANYIFSLDLKAGIVEKSIIDSIDYRNTISGTTYSMANAGASNYASIMLTLDKTYMFKDKQVMPTIYMGLNRSNLPRYINGSLYQTNTFSTILKAGLSYTYKNLLLVSANHALSFFRNTQFQSEYYTNISLSNITTLNFTLNQFKHCTFNINVKNTDSKLSNDRKLNYVLLNSSILYRFLKSEQLEMKFSALDILKQNRNVLIDQFENRVTRSEINSLQRYFMVSLSYYPRLFNQQL